jgi:hypothetical protein
MMQGAVGQALGARAGTMAALLATVLLGGNACAARSGTESGRDTNDQRGGSASSCFPVASLTAADRREAERVLLEFADREGLYTLAGGVKPISSDVRDLTVRIAPTTDSAALATLDQQRRIAAALTCGDIGAFVQVFTATQRRRDSSEVRNTSMVVFHRAAVRRTIEAHATFFASLGVTPSTDPREVVLAVENAPRSPRWRGYGYLFGYPDDAVDFFVRAGEEGDASGKLVPRDFRRIETWHKYPAGSSDTTMLSSFVFAVPKGAAQSEQERALRAAAAPVYARYVRERAAFIQRDSSGAVALFRRWVGGGR